MQVYGDTEKKIKNPVSLSSAFDHGGFAQYGLN